ncbi:MAG: chain length determinant protein EpsF [Rubrivivax sp.]|nr:chain length determinant protein EpsF [Rubrivivax sp.]
MSFGQFLSILRARWLAAVLLLGLTVATTLVVSLLLPKSYRATASVVVDFKPDPISAAFYGAATPPAVMATQADVIKSERVALRVVRNLKLSESPQVRTQWEQETQGEGTIEQWLVDLFQRNMDVLPSRESSVITISYKAQDPRFAAALANAFVQAYIETTLELRVDPARQYAGFFDVRAKEAREALEKAQSRLSAFQKDNSIFATDERFDVENARLSELSSQLVQLQAVASDSTSRQAQANSAQSDRIQEVLANPVIGALKADLSRAEGQLQGLSARLGDAHPQVGEVKASIAELRRRVEAETAKVTSGVGVSNTINRQREAQTRAQLEAQRAQVLRMKAVRDEGMVIQRDVENSQRAYDAIFARLNQTSLESQTTQSNVNVLTQATPPIEHAFPKVWLNLLLSVFVGTLLAAGVVLGLELRDRRVRALDDVVAALGLPVIGVLPRPGAKRAGGRAASPMRQRLLAPLPEPKEA